MSRFGFAWCEVFFFPSLLLFFSFLFFSFLFFSFLLVGFSFPRVTGGFGIKIILDNTKYV